MSSANSYPHCAIEITPSATLRAVAVALLLLAALAPWFAGLPWPLAVLLSLTVLLVALPILQWTRGELLRVHWHGSGRWLLVDTAGREHEAEHLLPGIVISAPLVALRWRCECCRKRFRVAILYDNSDSEARRKLQVRLRLATDDELFAGPINSASE